MILMQSCKITEHETCVQKLLSGLSGFTQKLKLEGRQHLTQQMQMTQLLSAGVAQTAPCPGYLCALQQPRIHLSAITNAALSYIHKQSIQMSVG